MLRRLLPSLMAALLCLAPGAAEAGRPALDPQNRVHAGLSVAGGEMFDAPSFGAAVGFDSRMSRLLSVDVGGFVSPMPLGEVPASFEAAGSSIYLRHGIYVAPGFRIPHRASEGLSWDVLIRAGFAGVWWTDAAATSTRLGDDYLVGLDPAGLGGVDFVLRKGSLGARLGAKGYAFTPFSQSTLEPVLVLRPQGTAEAFYQW